MGLRPLALHSNPDFAPYYLRGLGPDEYFLRTPHPLRAVLRLPCSIAGSSGEVTFVRPSAGTWPRARVAGYGEGTAAVAVARRHAGLERGKNE